ncbi:hypothetical protein OJJOAM_002618 [Cupriavidus sp. H18C1]
MATVTGTMPVAVGPLPLLLLSPLLLSPLLLPLSLSRQPPQPPS